MSEPAIDVEILRSLMLEHLHVEVPSADVDLLESGLLDSLQLVDLLLLIERHLGKRIAIEAIDLENLRTLTRLAGLLSTPAAASASGRRIDRAEAEPGPLHGSRAARREPP